MILNNSLAKLWWSVAWIVNHIIYISMYMITYPYAELKNIIKGILGLEINQLLDNDIRL